MENYFLIDREFLEIMIDSLQRKNPYVFLKTRKLFDWTEKIRKIFHGLVLYFSLKRDVFYGRPLISLDSLLKFVLFIVKDYRSK